MINTILCEHDLKSYDFCIRVNMELNLQNVNISGISYRLTRGMIKCLKIHCDRIIHDKDYIINVIIPEISKKLGIDIIDYSISSNLYATIYLVLRDDILDFIKLTCATNEWSYYIRDKKIKNNTILIHRRARKNSFLNKIIKEHREYICEIFINYVITDWNSFVFDDDDLAIIFKDITFNK